MVYLAFNVFLPLQLSSLFSEGELTIGYICSAPGIARVLGEVIFSPLFRAIGCIKWQLMAATTTIAAFATSMAAVTCHTLGMAIAFTALAGLAIGWVELVTLVVVGLVAPPNDIGVAQGFFASTRLVFGTVAISIYLSIWSNKLTVDLPQRVTVAVEAAGLPASSLPELFAAVANGSTTALDAVPGVNLTVLRALDIASKEAYAEAFKVVYLATLAFTGVGIITAFFVTDVSEYLTNYVNKVIHGTKREDKMQSEA